MLLAVNRYLINRCMGVAIYRFSVYVPEDFQRVTTGVVTIITHLTSNLLDYEVYCGTAIRKDFSFT